MIDVDWSSLMPKHKQEPRAAGAALLRFTPGAVLLRSGISKRLAGPELLEQVREVCKRELDDPKGKAVFSFFYYCEHIPRKGGITYRIFRLILFLYEVSLKLSTTVMF